MHPLISTEALAVALAGERPPVVLDVRWRLGGPPARQDYEVGHVPGAVHTDLDAALAAPPGPEGRHPLPEASALQRALRAAGVREGVPVVAYDDKDGSVAARAWWLLRWAGHDQVAVLDGGYSAWSAEGRPVTAEEPEPAEGDVVVRPGRMPIVDADGAAELAREGVLLDARAGARYRGEVEPVDPKAGHIPGAVSAPSAEHAGEDGRWLPARALADRFQALGVTPDRPVGAYCGSGVTASSVVLALEAAGLTTSDTPALLYPGSWSNWSAQDRPVATGDQPG
ncbi:MULTISPECIES: sulfurtransferase [Actinosynnema]|uniref:sulfurtransferase n=1 Tax=Actinosynnema TaxID=40566 RepID=UPI0020A2FEE8|nr:sulfurtransferase [Actinosynnema pretiosum]MCP2093243.1 thiosulfate/3-mercaptopyruvate sulfurtransferase [Actinosynnema pretiosum]